MVSATSLVLALSALAGSAAAQSVNHQIVVGGAAGLVFTPANITAAIGDTVSFIYQSKNHTVTQSAFPTPCELLTNATTGTQGFDSSYVPVAVNATDNPVWTLEVTVSTPLWFFCKQGAHCKAGMVGSINAVETGNKSFADFKALAMSSTGATTASGTAVISSGVGAVATGSLSSVAAGATSTSPTSGASAMRMSGAALFLASALAVFVL